MMKNYFFSLFGFLNKIFRHCVGGIIQSVQQRVRIRLLKKQKRSICHATSDIKQSITRNRLVLHYSRSVKRCYGFYRLVLRGATLCFTTIEVYFVKSDAYQKDIKLSSQIHQSEVASQKVTSDWRIRIDNFISFWNASDFTSTDCPSRWGPWDGNRYYPKPFTTEQSIY